MFVWSCLLSVATQAQSVRVEAGVEYIPAGQSIQLPIVTDEFTDIDAFQFSLSWDTSFLTFQEVASFGLPLLTEANFGTSQANEGYLTVLWTGNLVNGETLLQGDSLFTIRFTTNHACLLSSVFSFPEEPLQPRFLRFDGLDPVALDFELTDSPLITFCPLQLDSIIVNDNPCFGDSLGGIFPSVSGGVLPYEFLWSNGSTSGTLDSLQAGSYSYVVNDAIGNELVIDSILVSEGPLLVLELGNDTILCSEEQFSINGTSLGVTEIEWFWDGNFWEETIVPELNITQSGTYFVIGTDDAGCEVADTIQILFAEVPEAIILTPDTTVCQGDSLLLEGMLGEETTYNWSAAGGILSEEGSPTPIAYNIDSTAVYTLVTSNSCGLDTAMILVNTSNSDVSAGRDTCIAVGSDIVLGASGGVIYQWINTEYELSDYTIPNPTTTPVDSTWYVVEITDAFNCRYLDSVFVAVIEDPFRFIPSVNILTPNNDGHNDQLIFPGLEKYAASQLQVFNRWGDLVYKSNDYNNDWDGTMNGKLVPAGVYFYNLRIETQERRQTLTIITP